MIKKNDIITTEIEEITGQGSGIAKIDGMAVFVPQTAVGDKINAHILKVKKNYAFAKVESIITPSENRIQPDCECYSKCGGCVFRHIAYEEELKIKQRRVFDALTRIGGLHDFDMGEIIGCKSPNSYRNKAQMPVGRDNDGSVITGFFAPHSHRIVKTDSCALQLDEFNAIIRVVKNWITENNISVYDETTHKGLVRHIYLRRSAEGAQIMVCLIINGKNLPNTDTLTEKLILANKNITSIILNINTNNTNVILGNKCITIYGSDTISDTLCGLKFNISPLSFYQVNRDQTERLYALAAEYAELTGSELLIDLYCGAGTIGLSMADKVKSLIGVEIVPEAIQNAKENAKTNGIHNAEFICADAEAAAKLLAKRRTRPDVVIIDPPRKGCAPSVIDSICEMSPSRVVYVSCDPETLARDLKLFDEKGYKTEKVTPVDMFPRTGHVETVVLMSRVEGK